MADRFEELEAYDMDMRHYRRAKAMGDWQGALAFLDKAITLCPCDEALPTLSALREEAATHAKPKSFLAKMVLGVKS